MHPQLQQLRQDHINLAKVLRLLENLLSEVRHGEPVDLDMLSEIVDYVQSYPDRFHHRCEDAIFSVYLEHPACRHGLVERLMGEHTLLVGKTHELGQYIQQWRNDSPVPRERVVCMIADYLQLQWDHMNTEEGSVFNWLELELTEGDWGRIEASTPAATDPLFGNPMRRRFENIFERFVA